MSCPRVPALTGIATADNEALLLGYAQAATAAQIERIVRGYRQLERVPEAFPQQRGSTDALRRLHARRGLAIGPKTCGPGRDGRRVDYGEAVGAVWEADKGTRRVSVPPPRPPRVASRA